VASSKYLINKIKSKTKSVLSNFNFKFFASLNFKNSNSKWQSQTDLDKKLVFSLSKSRIPSLKQLKYIKKFLSPQEIFLVRVCFLIIIISSTFLGFRFYKNHLVVAPVKGGEYSEALIGIPKYINPLYSNISDVDSDIASLVYSSLFKRDKNGELTKDLVENYSVSPDNKIYTITIKENVRWHNGNILTTDDIVFTFNAIKDTKYKSPLRLSFSGVEIEKVDDKIITFNLSAPYAAFLELLTFGIMPSEYWGQIAPESANLAELNIKPIGSGPYKFKEYTKDKTTGAILDYSLIINEDYYKPSAYVNLKFKFYPNFEEAVAALKDNLIDGISYLPKEQEKNISIANSYNFNKLHIPQITLIYLNSKVNPALGIKQLRQALALAIDRNEIVNNILGGDGYLVDGPILPNSFAYNNGIKKYQINPGEAGKILDNIGYKIVEIKTKDIEDAKIKAESKDEKIKNQAEQVLALGEGNWRAKDGNFLIIKLTTVDRSENQQVTEAIKNYWEKIGIKTELEIYPSADIQKDIIKTRNFQALFYGLVLGADPDPYAFWHSSQIGDNGYNIANFANKEVDQLLEDARLISDTVQRQEKYKRFQEIISEETPAIFMYSPTYTYLQSKKIKNFEVVDIIYPYDRFSNITEWYIETKKKISW
jgi:peptide/nickel transport system substrate-binding protein